MKNVPMRFCGVAFHHNPATLTIHCSGNISELESPCFQAQSEHLGNRVRHISGEGELYGSDCIEQYRRLEQLFDNAAVGLLSLPHMPSVYAYLKDLRMTAEPKDNVLGYRFEFVEAGAKARDDMTADSYQTIVPNESLWDVSYRYGIDIDTLVRLNPQIKYIDDLDEDEVIRLC